MVLARLVFMRFIHFKNKNIPSQYYAATYLSIYLSIIRLCSRLHY
jgi:hypothetical protein